MKAIDIMSNYQTASSLLCNYPVESIPNYAVDEVSCILGIAPRLKDIDSYYQEVKSTNEWLGKLIDYFCRAGNVAEINNDQVLLSIQLIKSKYGALKITEIMLFAYKFLGGEYEKFYQKYDTQAVMRSLYEFSKFRRNVICRNEKREEPVIKFVGVDKFNEYLTHLQRAVYGDKESMAYLRLDTYEDIVRCVAMRVKKGSFPRSILDSIDFRYNDLVESILNSTMQINVV